MKRLLIIVMLFSLVQSAFAQDFRQASWGSSKSDVRSQEASALKGERADSLFYMDTIAGKPCTVGYFFASSAGLVGGMISFTAEHSNRNDYIADFESIKKLFISKYGSPSDDRVNWKNDLYKDDPQEWGMAVAVGHLEYFAVWEGERTRIVLSLRGDNFKMSLDAAYYSKGNWQKYGEERDAADQSKF